MFALAFFSGAYFFFYRGGYQAPPTVKIPFEEITAPSSSLGAFAEVPPIRSGVLLLDLVHSNNFEEAELGSLMSRLEDRGYTIDLLGERDHKDFPPPDVTQRLALLDEKLRGADSFAVILPDDSYATQEVDIVERFVKKGGRLLLIADPTRDHDINSLANRFGIAFQSDYLYNTVEYDLNFQDIFIRDFRPDEITRDLSQIALYTAGSIKSFGGGLAYTDANTRSSMVERAESFFPLVKGRDGNVVAISDLTFMIPPQNSILDNDKLVSNLADFLTGGDRRFELADFPHFFDADIDILLGRASLLGVATELKSLLSTFQLRSDIRGVEDLRSEAIYLGLFEDSPNVVQYLDVAGIQVDGTLRTPFTPDIATDGTAIILLHRTRERHVLVILGHSEAILLDTIDRLGSGTFRSGLVDDMLGVYGPS
ncbi:MAG: hypothetical protein IH862_07750 [Chloroflexi bacterium]|nr:hypothetical protein [Chloroflexota bacterium]